MCAQCQKPYPTMTDDEFPINYGKKEVISEMRKSKVGAAPKRKPAKVNPFSLIRNKQEVISNDQEDTLKNLTHAIEVTDSMRNLTHTLRVTESLRNLTQIIEETVTDLNEYRDFIRQRKLEHIDLLSKVFDIVHQNEDIIRKLESEEKKLEGILQEGDVQMEKVIITTSKYNNATSTRETSVEADLCVDSLSEWKRRINSQLPDVLTVVCSDMLMRDTIGALKVFTLVNEAKADIQDFKTSSLPVMDKIKRIKGKPTLMLSKLQVTSGSIKEALKKGHIYAIQSKEGSIRSGRVTVEDNKVYLHCLQDEEPPAYAHTIQQSELIEALEMESVTTFMDLYWEGSVQGRILIRLSPYNAIARHFRTLCTGDFGPSYLQTRFMTDKEKYRTPLDSSWFYDIHGGDYENNDGSGGAPLTSGLYPRELPESFILDAGVVSTRFVDSDGSKIAQFSIRLVDLEMAFYDYGVFGFVEEGLALLKSATAVDDINQVKVANCGVVFNLDNVSNLLEVYDNLNNMCGVM